MTTIFAACLNGIDAKLVRVSVGPPGSADPKGLSIAGLSEHGTREALYLVRGALDTRPLIVPDEPDAVVRIEPAVTHGCYDVAILAAMIASRGENGWLNNVLVHGRVSNTMSDFGAHRGLVPALLAAREAGILYAIVPWEQRDEACLVPEVTALCVRDVRQLAEVLLRVPASSAFAWAATSFAGPRSEPRGPDLAEVSMHYAAKRALEVAAAGHFGVLFVGPPGAGKTMLARRMSGLMPPLSNAEALDVARIQSAAGLPVGAVRPFRAPHHTVSETGLVGGGRPVRPGEVTLARHGVLFLDELPEFRRSAVEKLAYALRRDGGCKALVIASAMSCPCGASDDNCRCAPKLRDSYRQRVMEYADLLGLTIRWPLPRLDDYEHKAIAEDRSGPRESSDTVRQRVTRAVMRWRIRHVLAAQQDGLGCSYEATAVLDSHDDARLREELGSVAHACACLDPTAKTTEARHVVEAYSLVQGLQGWT